MKSNSQAKKRTGYIISHTHWDREWRWPIWGNRMMLKDFMEELIPELEKGTYPGYLMDGQVSPILDYLEVCPEMKDRLAQLIKENKLQVGPWFVNPDEYPVDGECLIRNLLIGTRKSKEFGNVMLIGYTPFGWGQTAQLPQIYKGFGMDIALIGKRVSRERAPESEFIWQAPDGSQLLATRFGDWGRQNFYLILHLSALFGVEHTGDDWKFEWGKTGIAYHRADYPDMEEDYEMLTKPIEKWHPEFVTPELVDMVWDSTKDSVLDDDRLMMDGCDHYSAFQPLFKDMIAKVNEVDSCNDRQWVHSTLPDFVEIMRKKIDRSKLHIIEGELRDGPAQACTGNALTTRLYLKSKNKHAQNMLIRFAEPMAFCSLMIGSNYPLTFFNKAWDFLLKAQPHDSINGVGLDKTADDTEYCINQAVEISERIGDRSMAEIIKAIDFSRFAQDDVILVVFNSLPCNRRDVVEAWVDIPGDLPSNHNWAMISEGLVIEDAKGNEMPIQWHGAKTILQVVQELHTRGFPFKCRKHRIYFDTGDIPACGYKVFRVKSSTQRNQKQLFADSCSLNSNILQSPNVLENEYLRVKVNPNGTFDVLDKETGSEYKNLNYFEDRGEVGDFWINKRPMFDQIHTTLGCSARIWSEETGPIVASLVSEVILKIPQNCDQYKNARNDNIVDLKIKIKIMLKAGERKVDVTVELENRHENHFLRVMFPSGITEAAYADAGGHFYVDRRSIRPQGPGQDLVWTDMATLPHNNFVDVSDGKMGLAIVNIGLTEYEVVDNKERTIALSLLRCVKNTYCRELRVNLELAHEQGGQSLGKHTFRYSIVPHKGNWQDVKLPLVAEQVNVPLRLVQTSVHAGILPGDQHSFMKIKNENIHFSAIKKAIDRESFILRVYNPTDSHQTSDINFPSKISKAWRTNLDEERIEEIEVIKDSCLNLKLAAYKIETIEVELE